jgi:hypothetical protein
MKVVNGNGEIGLELSRFHGFDALGKLVVGWRNGKEEHPKVQSYLSNLLKVPTGGEVRSDLNLSE